VAETHDPIALELFKNAVFSIADEMALTVFRTTYSGVLKDNMDYSTGFADADGKLAAQGLTLPGHLGSIPTAMESIMRHFRDDMSPGDVFIMNDPFDGGMHLPDIFIFKPLYHEGERLAFACTVCHHTDVGGRVAGSNASDSTEIYAEGLRIAPMKLYEAGKLNKTIMTFIEKNVRLPVLVFGDLRAQLAACHIAEKQFAEIVARFGPQQTTFYLWYDCGPNLDAELRCKRACSCSATTARCRFLAGRDVGKFSGRDVRDAALQSLRGRVGVCHAYQPSPGSLAGLRRFHRALRSPTCRLRLFPP
jgi:N-methylhydantoinase B